MMELVVLVVAEGGLGSDFEHAASTRMLKAQKNSSFKRFLS